MDFSTEFFDNLKRLSEYYKDKNEFASHVKESILSRFYMLGLGVLASADHNEFYNNMIKHAYDSIQSVQRSCIDSVVRFYKQLIPEDLQNELDSLDSIFQDNYFLNKYMTEDGGCSGKCRVCGTEKKLKNVTFTFCRYQETTQKDMQSVLCLNHFNHILSYLIINSNLKKEEFLILSEWEQQRSNLDIPSIKSQLFESPETSIKCYKNFVRGLEFFIQIIKSAKRPDVAGQFKKEFPSVFQE